MKYINILKLYTQLNTNIDFQDINSLFSNLTSLSLFELNDLKNNLGLSYLFISHDLSVVKHMSDRVMIMREGEIIEIQEADQLYRNPKNNYTKKLIEAVL